MNVSMYVHMYVRLFVGVYVCVQFDLIHINRSDLHVNGNPKSPQTRKHTLRCAHSLALSRRSSAVTIAIAVCTLIVVGWLTSLTRQVLVIARLRVSSFLVNRQPLNSYE